ncbi:hypothetical protein EJB05_32859, partial [Eragrostis curvula]
SFGYAFGQGIWRGLSKKVSSSIRCNVVALASFNGESRLFACTGFVIKWNRSTIILTSASLVRSSGYENKIEENLRIEVYANERCTQGTLQHYSLHYNVAPVGVKDDYALLPAKIQLDHHMFYKVAAVGRCFESGKLMAANGVLIGIGGPLVTFDGKVISMNFYDKKIGTPFLVWDDIHNILAHFKDTVK